MERCWLSVVASVLGLVVFACSRLEAQELLPVQDGLAISLKDWPWWRGPGRNGIAATDQQPPMVWSETQHVAWKVPIPGRGYGSPIIFGERIFLQTADEATDSQSVLCFERETGKLLWNEQLFASGGMRKNKKSTAASNTPACDGERIFVNFLNAGAVYTTALDLTGKKLWQQKISSYVIHQGYGSSPALYRSLVIVSADNKGGGAIIALDRQTGEIVWRRERPATPNYPSPILVNVQGRDQVILTGCDLVVSYAPLTGEILWETAGATTECVTSTVTDGSRIFTSGGYPKNHMSAVMADGSAKLVWENQERLYVPSFLYRAGYLYAVLDAGIAGCWKADDGKEMWKARLGGTFSSSPVLVGENIFATNEAGETFVWKADPQRFVELAKNVLGEEVFATPVFVGSRIYYRATEMKGDQRQEYLYCLANP